MKRALTNFSIGVVGTLAVALLGIGVAWVMVFILEYFRPMLGVFGGLMAFYTLLAIVIGALAALFGASGKPAE